jgi:hypothetical protein
MLALFKSKPLLDEQEQQWLIDTFVWAVENFDSDYFINNSQLVLPNHQCFPDAVSSIEEMASKVFERVVGYAGLGQLRWWLHSNCSRKYFLILLLVISYVVIIAN